MKPAIRRRLMIATDWFKAFVCGIGLALLVTLVFWAVFGYMFFYPRGHL